MIDHKYYSNNDVIDLVRRTLFLDTTKKPKRTFLHGGENGVPYSGVKQRIRGTQISWPRRWKVKLKARSTRNL